MLKARDVVGLEVRFLALLGVNRHGWVNFTLIIDSEEHATVEAMMGAQDLGHHRHRLFAAVFLIGGDQHNVFAFARAIVATRIRQPLRVVWNRVSEGLTANTKDGESRE